jgi:hypothetical protein
MQKLLNWLDKNGLMVLAGFLLVFIPLYPKLPLLDVLPGYIVRVRIEDFIILFTVAIWVFQLIRRKVTLHPLFTKLIIAYLIIGLLSTLSAIFVTKTVPWSDIHLQKIFLHFFRRIEYFSLFFIFFSCVKSIKEIKIFITLLIGTMITIATYGFGQKYLYWPVFSTMNREFSKGWRLYLTEHARVPSTFGGHYDAAAYTLVIITIMLAIIWYSTNKWIKYPAILAYLSGLWLLVLTASRTSFVGYLAAISILAFISIFLKKWWWPIPRYFIVLFLSLFVMLTFGDLSERFSQILGLQNFRTKFADTFLSAKIEKPKDGQAVSETDLVSSASDQPPATTKPLPGDVYENIPIPEPIIDASGSATGEFKNVSRTYSDNAYKYGLSAAIRLDTLWPRAIAGFQSNILLGSGYSTLTKDTLGQFTEAESTDNDYLRSLGETGLLGFLSFFGIILTAIFVAIRSIPKVDDPLLKAVLMGYAAGAIGLLINAIYIDVFEASKVALSFWALTGVMVAISVMKPVKKYEKK